MTTPGETDRLGAVELLRRFATDRGDEGFAVELAARAVDSLPDVTGRRVLDVGCGPGHYSLALEARGAMVAAVELSHAQLCGGAHLPRGPVVGDARSLPFPDATFDAVLCSNMLEHTPDPLIAIDEIERVLRPGGWAYLSWTNWLSPWGGHAIAPLHYLGAERGLRIYRRLLGEPKGTNLPFDGVWPLHVRDVLAHLRQTDGLAVEEVEPRYYPWLRAIMRVPGLREVAAWNCVIWVRRVPDRPTTRHGRTTPS